jgi:DNA repair exonuclease SbcCD ATPase subunit
MNELARTPEMVGAEIRSLTNQAKAMTLWYGVEIGRRLEEAKTMVAFGEWGAWIARETEFSQSTAGRFMKLFDEYGADQIGLLGAEVKSSTLKNLSISNALRLLAVPEEEREEFAEAVDAENLSARELEKAIKERDEAMARLSDKDREAKKAEEQAKDALEKAQNASLDAAKAIADASAMEQEKKRLEEELAELKNRPVEVAVERDEAAVQEAAKAEREKAQEEIDRVNGKLEAAREKAAKAADAAKDAEYKRKCAEETAETLRKKLAAADNDVAVFQAYFGQIQDLFNRANGVLQKIRMRDGELAGKLQAFTKDALGKMGEAVG